MVGFGNIVVDGLGYADDLYVDALRCEIAVELHYGIHRVISADVEERFDIMAVECVEYLNIAFLVLLKIFQLEAARTEYRGRSFHEKLLVVLVHKNIAEI